MQNQIRKNIILGVLVQRSDGVLKGKHLTTAILSKESSRIWDSVQMENQTLWQQSPGIPHNSD